MANSSSNSKRVSTSVDRRTLMVWGCLIASMTVASGLLLWLEPQPIVAAPGSSLSLSALEQSATPMPTFLDPARLRQHHWKQITIHHSGQTSGNAQTLTELHEALGYGQLQYHFVIGNGRGAGDGEIQIGPLWQQQADDVYAPVSISICLIGNGDQAPPTAAQMRQLVRLVTALQEKLHIQASDVRLHSELAQTTSPGRFFPVSRLRPFLLTTVTP